jgi:hypothetical protein
MATRKPLVVIDGQPQELPAGDTLAGAGTVTVDGVTIVGNGTTTPLKVADNKFLPRVNGIALGLQTTGGLTASDGITVGIGYPYYSYTGISDDAMFMFSADTADSAAYTSRQLTYLKNNTETIIIDGDTGAIDIFGSGSLTLSRNASDALEAVPLQQLNAAIATATTGFAKLDAPQTFTKAQAGAVLDVLDDDTITLDSNLSNNFRIVLDVAGATRELAAPTNLVAGRSGVIEVVQDSTGGREMTFDPIWHFVTDNTLSTDPDAVDLIAYYVVSGAYIHASIVSRAGAGGSVDLSGVVKLAGNQTMLGQKVAMNGASNGGAWDGDAQGQILALTLTANTSFTAPTNIQQFGMYLLRLQQDGTGSRTAGFDTAYKFGSAGAPTLTTGANKVDILSFIGGAGNTLEFLGIRKDAV